ncbi:hypothetical protein DFP72DRAFT_898027 [Ephemerocybe angulata]|uniref:BZIP domain-containing protein n=1 Tax=Ephemerocybe angulata TaxID=980116 RepID=A0A8H6HX96_9AGAR|nr:hypothetical protein DFP72DRAFT_898027 [Tulosesus angulatus]
MHTNTAPGIFVSQRDRDADSPMSSWPAEVPVTVKSELTQSPDSRHSRPHTPAVPPTTSPSPSLASKGAISSLNNKSTTTPPRQDVLLLKTSASSTPAPRTFGHPSTPLETPVSSYSQPPQHVITNHHKRLRTPTDKVFASPSDLAAHYGIPQILPPPPITTHRSAPRASTAPQNQNPLFDFNALKNQYLNMLATPATDAPMSADRQQMAAPPAPAPSAAAQAPSGGANELEELFNYLSSPEFKDHPTFGESTSPSFDMNQYLTSPLPDLMHDFDESPGETPYNDFLTTPVIAADHEFPGMGGVNEGWGDMPLFPLVEADHHTKHLEAPAPASIDMDGLFTISPGTPMIDTPSMDPVSLYPTPRVPSTASGTPTVESAAASARRRSNATGTRKGITPDSLVPIDAPTQPRKYVTPSATSRKELPAVFARKRARSQALGDEEDELDNEHAPGPNATEKEQIEWKRRQNTLAARKSRKRKLQHQQELEDSVKALATEKEVWKTRALTFRQLLVSHGIPFNEFQD